METTYSVAGIDVHKKMLAVVVANARETECNSSVAGSAQP
jgi:hypothetical protein